MKQVFEFSAPIEFAAAMTDAPAGLQKLKIVAYTGGILRSPDHGPVVVDLPGLEAEVGGPILRQHDPKKVVGHSTIINNDGRTLEMHGLVSGTGEDAIEVVRNAKNGFTWQASIKAELWDAKDIKRGERATVNGQNLIGPFLLATKSKLKEVSVTPNGLDDGTSVKLAAAKAAEKDSSMEPTQIAASGAADSGAPDTKNPVKLEAAANPAAQVGLPAVVGTATISDPLLAQRMILAAESTRVGEIYRLSAKYAPTIEAAALADLQAAAIRDGRSAREFTIDCREAERPTAPAAHIRDASVDTRILQAAFDISCGVKNEWTARQNGMNSRTLEAAYGDEVLSAVDRKFKRGISLVDLMLHAAVNNGYSGPMRNFELGDMLQAAFSSSALSTLLTTTGNKILLESFMSAEQVWREIAQIGTVVDFKAITSYRLSAGGAYEEVSPAGEISMGSFGQSSRTNQAKTFGQIFAITRQQIINDDLNAFQQVPALLGRNGILALNSKFWTAFLADTAFFLTANNNYITGSTTTLLIDGVGLALGEKKALDMTDPDGNPMPIQADYLLTPTALGAAARQLYAATNLVGGSTTVANANIYANKFRPLVSSYLTASATAWYLGNSNALMRPMQVVFLNGQQTPIIENAQADFSVLGIQMRGYFDFGCALLEPLGTIKSKGAA